MATPRRGVPQGAQTHVLLPGGVRVLERYFPGGFSQLVEKGAKKFDYGESAFHLNGKWMPKVATQLFSVAQSRSFLDRHLQEWVHRIPNVDIRYGRTVTEIHFDKSGKCITGLSSTTSELGPSERLSVDLVVDASGRNTHLLKWLFEKTTEVVSEVRVGINVGYATGRFRIPPKHLPSHPLLYIVGQPPNKTKVGALIQIEDEIVSVGLAGYHGDYPPNDLPGFISFAKALPQPHIYEMLAHSSLLSPIARYRVPESLRRSFFQAKHFPTGLLVIGDGIASLDPIFAQGMSVAALEAEAMDESLTKYGPADHALQHYYFGRVDKILNVAWDLSTNENLKYPQTKGARPKFFDLMNSYKLRVATSDDSLVLSKFYEVLTLTASPLVLLRPGVMLRVLGSTNKTNPMPQDIVQSSSTA